MQLPNKFYNRIMVGSKSSHNQEQAQATNLLFDINTSSNFYTLFWVTYFDLIHRVIFIKNNDKIKNWVHLSSKDSHLENYSIESQVSLYFETYFETQNLSKVPLDRLQPDPSASPGIQQRMTIRHLILPQKKSPWLPSVRAFEITATDPHHISCTHNRMYNIVFNRQWSMSSECYTPMSPSVWFAEGLPPRHPAFLRMVLNT